MTESTPRFTNEDSALILHIPEVEDLVEPFRRQWDPTAQLGVPAHITLLYPFLPSSQINSLEISKLERLFVQVPAFHLTFSETRRWPDVLYLHPSPPEPVKALMNLLFENYPLLPPYGGEIADPTPHLTIAQMSDARRLDESNLQFNQAALTRLPIQARVREVCLIQKHPVRWEIAHRIPLKT